jgi:hypothetical protein
MSEGPPLAAESTEASPSAKRRSSRRQLGVQRLILLVAAIAVWMAAYVNRQRNTLLDDRIKVMVPLAHELIVDDPSKLAVVKLEQTLSDDNRWDLYLPSGAYRLCLATRKVGEDGLAPLIKSVPIRSGNHRLALTQELTKTSGRVTVMEGKAMLLDMLETAEWYPDEGSIDVGHFSLNEQLPTDKPVILYRRRFYQPTGRPYESHMPKGPTAGILLWIERVEGSKPGP